MAGTLSRHAWRRLGCLEELRQAVVSANTLDENLLVESCFKDCEASREAKYKCENWEGSSCPFGVDAAKTNTGSLAELRDMILFLKLAYDTEEPAKMKEDLVSTLQKWLPLRSFYALEKWFADRERETPFVIGSGHRPASGFKEIIDQLIIKAGKDPFGPVQSGTTKTTKKPSVYELPLKEGNASYIIFQGPPGTGKTREANLVAKSLVTKEVFELSEGQINLAEVNGKWSPEDRIKFVRHMQKFLTITQFHPSYSYEDFIEGLRPLKNKDGSIRYEITDGVFMATWRKAVGKFANIPAVFERYEDECGIFSIDSSFEHLYDFNELEALFVKYKGKMLERSEYDSSTHEIKIPNFKKDHSSLLSNTDARIEVQGEAWGQDHNFVLLIDEVNRGKVSKIFGELLFAMAADPADNLPPVKTQYSKTMVTLPSNLHIVCTMNTCDKSVDTLDQALKRRFQFVELMPLCSDDDSKEWVELRRYFKSDTNIDVAEMLDNLNDRLLISKVVEYDRQIGHSFFFKSRTITEVLRKQKIALKEGDLKRLGLARVFLTDIFPILQEFFIDDRKSLVSLVGEGMLDKNSLALNRNIRKSMSKIVNSANTKEIESAWLDLKPIFEEMIKGLEEHESPKAVG